MNRARAQLWRGWYLVAAGLALVFAACTQEDSGPDPSSLPSDLHYRVFLPAMALDSVHIELTVNAWPAETLTLLAPPVYADNPLPLPRTPAIRNLRVADASGDRVPLLDSVSVGLFRALRIRLTSATLPVEVSYDVAFDYQPLGGMPMPGIGPDSGYLQGTYLFAVPQLPGDIAPEQMWRRAWDITVDYDIGPGVMFHGDPLPTAYARTAYELLFNNEALGGSVIAQRIGGVQPFRFVNLSDTVYDNAMCLRLESNFAKLLGDIVPLFGPLDAPMTVILGVNRGGGLEGTYAFSIIAPSWADSIGVFDMVAAHETVHFWVGVRVGELDQPWWKEGTSNYMGFLISRRQGLCSQALFDAGMLADLTDSADVRDYALSSPRVRTHLYDADSGMGNLVYTKGGQVCMLMDLSIRQASLGATSFDRLLGQFTRSYDGRTFTWAEYIAFLESRSGAELDSIIARYIDQPGAIPVAVLTATADSLSARGAFGTPALVKRSPGAVALLPSGRW